jgi:acetyl-CoA carboxylase biotin carboxyl carrier protein
MSTGTKTVMADQENKQPEIVSAAEQNPERGHRERDRGRRRHRNQPKHLEASINMNELRELIGLITENGLTQFELEREGFRVKVGRGAFLDQSSTNSVPLPGSEKQISSGLPPHASAVQSIPTHAPHHPGAHAEEAASEDHSFVRIGSQVEPTTVVCIIEAMKLMNEIQAEISGEVVKIYVENGQAVEYGQPLFGIKQG